MPLNASSLGTEIKAAIQGIFDIEDEGVLQNFCNAVAQAVVDHIKNNALVSGSVTSGGGAGGNVTGTVS